MKTENLTKGPIIDFGVHKGKLANDVPASWLLLWDKFSSQPQPELRLWIEENRQFLMQEAELKNIKHS